MKTITKKLLLLIVVISGITSCASVSRTTTATPRTIEASQGRIIVKPLIADVEVDLNKKIKGTSSSSTSNVEALKELAKWEALTSSGADIIIDPVYYVTQNAMSIEVKVEGFYGKYTKIETIKDTELDKINMYIGSEDGQNGELSTNKSLKSKLNKLKN